MFFFKAEVENFCLPKTQGSIPLPFTAYRRKLLSVKELGADELACLSTPLGTLFGGESASSTISHRVDTRRWLGLCAVPRKIIHICSHVLCGPISRARGTKAAHPHGHIVQGIHI